MKPFKTLADAVDAAYPFGVPFQSCTYMAGMKKAALVDGKAMVSPAMLDLIEHSEGDELAHMLENIPIVTIDMDWKLAMTKMVPDEWRSCS